MLSEVKLLFLRQEFSGDVSMTWWGSQIRHSYDVIMQFYFRLAVTKGSLQRAILDGVTHSFIPLLISLLLVSFIATH